MPLSGERITVRDLITGAVETRVLNGVLGSGKFRKVFDCGDGLVAKYEERPYANLRELECWLDTMNTDAGGFLCPIVAASDNGSWLIQVKCVTPIEILSSELERQYYRRISSASSPEEEATIRQDYSEEYRDLDERLVSFVADVEEYLYNYGYSAYDLHGFNIGVM